MKYFGVSCKQQWNSSKANSPAETKQKTQSATNNNQPNGLKTAPRCPTSHKVIKEKRDFVGLAKEYVNFTKQLHSLKQRLEHKYHKKILINRNSLNKFKQCRGLTEACQCERIKLPKYTGKIS